MSACAIKSDKPITLQKKVCHPDPLLKEWDDPMLVLERRVLLMLAIPCNLEKPVKISPGIIARPHHTDQKQMGLLKDQCAVLKKGTSAVLLQSSLDEN